LNLSKEIVAFLKPKLPEQYILKSFIFGSVALGKKQPTDCDLFMVTCLIPSDGNWRGFIDILLGLKEVFYEQFHFPLNLTVNIKEEFAEHSEFKKRVLNGSTIDI